MRILSQDGLHEGIIDVPYEQVSIEQKENEYGADILLQWTGIAQENALLNIPPKKKQERLWRCCVGRIFHILNLKS